MSTVELKNKLIEKIRAISDEQLLLDAGRLLELEALANESVFKLSEGMKNAISEAEEQIANGESLTHEEANKEIDKWLAK